MTLAAHDTAPPPVDSTLQILACRACSHGRHLGACETIVAPGGHASTCDCHE